METAVVAAVVMIGVMGGAVVAIEKAVPARRKPVASDLYGAVGFAFVAGFAWARQGHGGVQVAAVTLAAAW